MPKFTITQKAELFYLTEVEADDFEAAIAKTQEPGYNYWTRQEPIYYLPVFTGRNHETLEKFESY